MKDYTDNLVELYHYKKLPTDIREEAHKFYKELVDKSGLKMEGDSVKLYSKEKTLLFSSYDRIVIGDYGAYIECSRDSINKPCIKCKKGQEYRFQNPYFKDKVKYFWYTAKDSSDCKIYFQQKKVSYADYKPFKFYISIEEIG
jgi:hypothetical protein